MLKAISKMLLAGTIVIASYYGSAFHGRKTASGEIFNMYAMTAAHLTFPFGTMLKVTNMKNKKSVVVRVSDRGPYIEGRSLDLSIMAAYHLDMLKDGVVPVKIEVLSD